MALREIIGPGEIAEAVARLAERINRDYRGKSLVLVGSLKGAFIFLADLARRLDVPVEIDFVRAASYGSGTVSSGEVRISLDVETDIAGRDVLVVDDIMDTGRTMRKITEHLWAKDPASLRVCALLDKPSRREVEVSLDYVGLEVGDVFVVGYGLDCAEKYRNLPGIYEVAEEGRE